MLDRDALCLIEDSVIAIFEMKKISVQLLQDRLPMPGCKCPRRSCHALRDRVAQREKLLSHPALHVLRHGHEVDLIGEELLLD